MVGLDFKIDLLINPRREVVQVFAGHYLEQHRAGVEVARTLYATPTPTECDVVVVNTYPIENQAAKGMWPTERSLKAGGIAVIISQCVEGQAPTTSLDASAPTTAVRSGDRSLNPRFRRRPRS